MLVKVENEKHVCELKTVAEYFGKRHADLIRDIKNLINNKADLSNEFVHTTEPDAQGKPRPTYHLTQKGFTILCMGFKGTKALELKCKFYDEFERLRNENRELRRILTDIVAPELNGPIQVIGERSTALAKKPKILKLQSIINRIERLRNENMLHNQYLQLLGLRNDNTVCISDICCKFKDLAPNVANNMLIEWDIITRRASGYYPNFEYLNGGYLISATAVNPYTNHLDNYVRYTPKGVAMIIDKFKEVGYEIQ